ncbi:MAG: D-cysteine desulfhydrase family protein [Sphaerobacteraceae bacterium]|nr:MAG: D-cysteine desulfhydrase family protein [Sphaerobacteraceae bacterium]
MKLGTLPKFPLAHLPTPLTVARNLSAALGGPEIMVKRDDLTGLALGGNKTRKLEYLIADAQAQGATHVITVGAAQSNHCRQTAAAARVAGLNCVLVMNASSEDPDIQGNLLLDHILGAETRIVTDKEARQPMTIQVAEELRAQGYVPYQIPGGGSNAIGSSAYVAATYELMAQLVESGASPTRLYTTSSASGGTHAGLALGAKLAGVPYAVHGVSIEGRADHLKKTVITPLANQTAEYLGLDVRLSEDEVIIHDAYTGPAYGVATEECLEAIRLCARTEALLLDPVYTAKTMAGLIDHIRTGEIGADETVMFLHTGGVPAVFADTASIIPAMQAASVS